MTTDYIDDADLEVVLALLMPSNRIVCQTCIKTGLRVGDVLTITAAQVKAGRFTVKEAKTKKTRRISLSRDMRGRIAAQMVDGSPWAFPSPADPQKHRTRQAVWQDVKRAQKALRLDGNAGPHSLRKVYAVREFKKSSDLAKVQKVLNHSDPAVTLIYAMADILTQTRRAERQRKRAKPR